MTFYLGEIRFLEDCKQFRMEFRGKLVRDTLKMALKNIELCLLAKMHNLDCNAPPPKLDREVLKNTKISKDNELLHC